MIKIIKNWIYSMKLYLFYMPCWEEYINPPKWYKPERHLK